MMQKLIILIITLFQLNFSSVASNNDSLESVLPTLNDSAKVNAMLGLALNYTYSDAEKSRYYTNEAIKITKYSLDTNSIIYARLNTQLGILEKNVGNFNNAAKYQHLALKIHENLGDTTRKYRASVYNDLGIIYKTLENWDVALKYYKKANEICQELELSKGVLMTYNNIGTVLIELNETDSAEHYYNLAYQLSKENNNLGAQALTLNNLGELMVKIGRKSLALDYFQKALKIDRETGDRFGIVFTLMNLGTLYSEINEFNKAEKHLEEGLEIAREQEAKYLVSQSLNTLSHVYESQEKFKNAYQALRETMNLNEEIFNDEKNKQINELEAKYQNEKKQQEIELQQAKINEKDAEIQRKKSEKKMFIYIICLGILILIGSLIGWNAKRRDNAKLKEKNIEIEHQKKIVEEKNKEITDSIHYAKRIQAAILPPKKVVKEYLNESFIFYKPKDIVAGDFYWLEHKQNKILFAACDCTGHGVPGAMVSVICNNGLNRSVREHNLTEPGLILDKTREIVIKEFEKSEDEVKDGMDIALCSLEDKTLKYAGANNPLWIIKKGTTEIIEIKADKQPIGKYTNPSPYTTHTLNLEKGDCIYIFSDGYIDQFGGEKGKKFKSANMKKLLLEICNKSMDQQKDEIEKTFENWKGNLEQLDDVCIIGVKV